MCDGETLVGDAGEAAEGDQARALAAPGVDALEAPEPRLLGAGVHGAAGGEDQVGVRHVLDEVPAVGLEVAEQQRDVDRHARAALVQNDTRRPHAPPVRCGHEPAGPP
jgi:hypothetical protein